MSSVQPKLYLNLYWHMHQPDYRDTITGQYVLPWTYLHAMKDYTDMAYHLEVNPKARVTFNFVPVLLDQLEDYTDQFKTDHIRDPLLAMLVRENLEYLSKEERCLIVDSCFKSHHEKMLEPFAHYQRLLNIYNALKVQGSTASNYLSGQYMADLLVWYHLAWTGESIRRNNTFVQSLMEKGSQFTLEERQKLFTLIGELISDLIPRYKKLQSQGQIEISSTPHYHPILPLLLDFKSTRDAMPFAPLPSCKIYPGGRLRAKSHIESAQASHHKRFGEPPIGMWPAEGAVSQAGLLLMAEQGVKWAATGEGVLANSLYKSYESGEIPSRSDYLYQPYRVSNGNNEIICFFRDDALSDKIGFEYSKLHASDAVRDFIGSLEAIYEENDSPINKVVSVILDGENAWEYYPYNAFYFLSELYEALALHPNIKMTTFSDIVASAKSPFENLPQVAAGSWVYGSFSTWIGSPDKNLGWDLLCDAKKQYDQVMQAGILNANEIAACEHQLSICEGSDWFWWFGDYNSSVSVDSFDRLYRRNLSNLYRLLKLQPPKSLSQPISIGGGEPAVGGTMRRGQEGNRLGFIPHVLKQRRAGILLHISSLPHSDLGQDAFSFVDFLSRIGATVWQTLPLNMTHADGSPYQCLSAHAGNPDLISLEVIKEQGWLSKNDLDSLADKSALISLAFDNFNRINLPGAHADFTRFTKQQAHWLDDFALFIALRKRYQNISWHDWPNAIKLRQSSALKQAQLDFSYEIALEKFKQFIFFEQWHELKEYANNKNIALFGDIPIFISYDSADVWAQPEMFKLDADLNMTVVAGVPPDYFSETGQRWGNPHYNWPLMQADGFKWWLARMRTQNALFDMVRIDHFRGLESAWEIPADEPTAINGEWVLAPGDALIDSIIKHLPLITLVAEDLGIITDEVNALREKFDLPGMKILQFAFDGSPENPYLPEKINENSVVYTGTHDNDTSLGWYEGLKEDQLETFHHYLKVHDYLTGGKVEMPLVLIQMALASDATLAIVPMQDVLKLNSEHRMNIPGTTEGNWSWHFDWSQLDNQMVEILEHLILQNKRNPSATKR